MEDNDFFEDIINQNDPVKNIIAQMKIVRKQILPFMQQVADFVIPNLPYILIILFGSLYLHEFLFSKKKVKKD